MERVTVQTLETFLQKLGERTQKAATLYILGGSALILLGAPRETVDVDYDTPKADKDFEHIIKQLADESHLDLENVPIREFIPLPKAPGKDIGSLASMAKWTFTSLTLIPSPSAR